jgi:hypothetical protein
MWFVGRAGLWDIPAQPGTMSKISTTKPEMQIEGLNIQVGTSGAPLIGEAGIVGMIIRDTGSVAIATPIAAIKSAVAESNLPFELIDAHPTIAPWPDPQARRPGSFDFDKHVYQLNWSDLKMLAMADDRAIDVLGIIESRRTQVWGMSNTDEGGYNSPGFAQLVWNQMSRPPAYADLPRDTGPPHPGDIVVYDFGYHLYYFRDNEGREFVVGMTPLGVLALDYDFGPRRLAILHTGLSNR